MAEVENTVLCTSDPNAGVSRSLFSKLNGMYTMAKSKLPSVATYPLQRIESGVADLIERNVSPKVVSSLESRLDNLIAPQMTKLGKVAQAFGDRATPVVEHLEKKIISTINVVERSKKRFNDLIENAKQVPQHLKDRATTLALDSVVSTLDAVEHSKNRLHGLIENAKQVPQHLKDRATTLALDSVVSTLDAVGRSKKRLDGLIENAKQVPQHLQDRATTLALESIARVDSAFDFFLPETETAGSSVETEQADVTNDSSQNEQAPVELPDDNIKEIVQRSIAISSKNLLIKVNKRVQKRVWQRVASAQGFMKRRTGLIHTNLMDYASMIDLTVAENLTVAEDVRAMSAAVLQFPNRASEVYNKLANGGSVCDIEFHAALQKSMGSAWHKAMGPAAMSYCEVMNRVLQARTMVLRAQETTSTHAQQVLQRATATMNDTYTVVTERAAIVFNKVAPKALREAAAAYLKRINGAAEVSIDDSFLRNFSSKLAAVVLLARNDLQETSVRLYDPIKNKWESTTKFDFGHNLMSLLNKVPILNFSQVYGFVQAMLDNKSLADMVAPVQSPSDQSPVEPAEPVEPVTKMTPLKKNTGLFSEVYGFIQTLLSNKSLADMVAPVQSPVEPVTTMTPFKKNTALVKDAEKVSKDATSIAIPPYVMAEFEQARQEWESTQESESTQLLCTGDNDSDNDETQSQDLTSITIPVNVLAKHVYETLSNDGTAFDFDNFLSTLRVTFELASGEEWKSTHFSSARRIFSLLGAGDDETQKTKENP